jgi:hypothetical protein
MRLFPSSLASTRHQRLKLKIYQKRSTAFLKTKKVKTSQGSLKIPLLQSPGLLAWRFKRNPQISRKTRPDRVRRRWKLFRLDRLKLITERK